MSKKAFVIGHPITHSKSPLIHGYWLKKHNINANYTAIEVQPRDLENFFTRLQAGEYIGGNITLPHKQQAIKYCTKLSKEAILYGAVNTIYRDRKNLVGHNTDGYGFLANLDQLSPGWDKRPEKAIVLGAGGAARAIIGALSTRGMKKIVILNRTLNTAQQLATTFSNQLVDTKFVAAKLDEFSKYAIATNIIVNTTSVGLNNTSFDNLDLHLLPKNALVNDIVYTPLLTPLLQSARECGLQTVDGLGMLLHQAAPGFEKWFGIFPEVSPKLRQIVIDELHNS